MKVLHITPSTGGYEEVTLIANRVNRNNSLAAIEKDGQRLWTGGFLISDTEQIRAVLDAIPKDKQYDFVREFKVSPFVKAFLEE